MASAHDESGRAVPVAEQAGTPQAPGPTERVPRGGGWRSIRWRMALLLLAFALPAIAGFVAMVGHFYARERAQIEQDALLTSRALALAVDRDLASGKVAALALAGSPNLARGDLAAFHREAKALLGEQFPGSNFVLSDETGQQLVNTVRPFGEALPRHGNPDQLRSVFATGRPVMSDVYVGGVLRRPVVSLDVPVRRDGKVVYVLSVGFFPERLGRILAQQRLPPEWVAAIFDTRGVIVARTRLADRYVGQPGAPALVKRMHEIEEGVVESETLEGIPVLSVFSRSSVTGWTVAIGVPTDVVFAEQLRSLAAPVAILALLLGAGLVLAWGVGGRISRSVSGLTGPARALGSGAPVVVPAAGIAEVDEVAMALQAAGSELDGYRHRLEALVGERTAALEQALAAARQAGEALREREEIYSAIVNQAVDGVVLVDLETLRFAEFNDAACRDLGYTRDEFAALTLRDIQADPTPELLDERIREILAAPGGISLENRHIGKDGLIRDRQISNRAIHIRGRNYMAAIWRDTTEERRVASEVREARERLDLALTGSGEALWDCDVTTGEVYLSEQWSLMLGGAAEETRTTLKALAALVPPEDLREVRTAVIAVVKGLVSEYDVEHRVRSKRGEWIWVRSHGMVTARDENGLALRMSGTNADVTARKAAEEQVRLAASVFGEAREGIIIADADASIIDVNRAFTDLTGYGREEVLGRNPRLLKSGHHEAAFYEALWRSLADTGHWEGEIWNRRKDGQLVVFQSAISAVKTPDGDTSHYISLFSDVTERKREQERIEELAYHDALTRLPNRALLADRMAQALARAARSRSMVAVCYMDLDGFKPVNDRFGHKAGDRLLAEIGHRLQEATRGQDTVARLGGDEFVLLLTDLQTSTECEVVLSRVLYAVNQPFIIDAGTSVQVSASIGVTEYPTDGGDADLLLRHADQAMYAAKQAGKNRYHRFDPQSDLQIRARQDMVGRARGGLAGGEFTLYYQPKVELRHGAVVGAEGLIRWDHPQQGLLAPASFMPIIDASDLSPVLGARVMRQALQQIADWSAAGLSIPVSVNVSASHLMLEDFASELASLLAEFPAVAPGMLELEIPEALAMSDFDAVSAVIERCKRLGVGIALDDFGTGYSSLALFRRLPADLLKIDQTFVRGMLDNPDDLAIVEGVIGLARTFGRRIIAEGVETIAHGLPLMHFGCDLAQGYAIAPPMPAAAFPAWAKAWKLPVEWAEMATLHWAREDFPLVLAEIQHRRWVDRVVAICDGSGNPEAAPPLDSRQCWFGQWYYGAGHDRYGHLPAFKAMEGLHEQVHRVGSELVALSAGDGTAARERIPELARARDDLVAQLGVVKRQIQLGAVA